MNKPSVLWAGLEQSSFPLDETAQEKYRILSKEFNAHVLKFSKDKKFRYVYAHETHFYLLPLYGKLLYLFPIYILMMFFAVPYIIFRRKINILVAGDPFIPGTIAAFWKTVLFWKRIGLLVEAFGNWVEAPAAPLPRILRWPVRLVINGCSHFSIKSANALRAESDVTLKKLKRYTKKDLPADSFNLFHMELFEKMEVHVDRKDKDYRMLFIGRVVKLKGVQYIIDVLGNVKDKHPEAKLLVGGSGEYMDELKKQAKNLGVEDKVIFLGHLGKRQVKEQLVNCDLFLLPSMSEGRPIVLIEAMAMGKPMIASNVGAISDIVIDGKNGFLIDPYKIEQLKEKIIYCLENKEKTKKQAEKGNKEILKNFGDRFTIKGWGRLYTNLINKTYQSITNNAS